MINVCIITYNHEKYIAKCLDSVLAQKADCEVNIIIGEDCSTDGTLSICKTYENKYPDKIKVYSNLNNVGMAHNFINTLQKCNHKYIAYIEGDDYWIDEKKLQNQWAILEKYPEIYGNFTNASMIDENENFIHNGHEVIKGKILSESNLSNLDVYNQEECLKTLKSGFATGSLFFKSEVIRELPQWFKNHPSDYALDLLITEFGYMSYLPDVTTVYRIHQGGVWNGMSALKQEQFVLERYLSWYEHPIFFKKYSNYLEEQIRDVLLKIIFFNKQVQSNISKMKLLKLHLQFNSIFKISTYKTILVDILFPSLFNK